MALCQSSRDLRQTQRPDSGGGRVTASSEVQLADFNDKEDLSAADRRIREHQEMERKEELKFGGEAMSLPADLSCLQGVGGAEGEVALATLEKQLICPICLELFNKPVVILPCQHNLCRKCANELYQPSLFQARTTMMINSGRFRCPSCRLEVVLDRHGVYGLPRNLLVENIIDVYKQEVSNYNNKVASSLPPPPPSPAQLTCSDHEGEKVNIYCLTCKVPTCSLCKVFGAHQSCQVAPLSAVYQLQKDELSEEVSSLKAYNDKVQALMGDIEQTCRNIEENSKTQKQRVCEQFNHILSILDEKRKAMTEKITSEQEEKTGHAQVLIRSYKDGVEANNKLMERAAGSMEEPDTAAFVQGSRELITKVIAAASFSPAETLRPGSETLSLYTFNFSRQERALRSIDFPRVVEEVPEEQETEPAPEEPKETSAQSTEPRPNHETLIQNPGSAAEPLQEAISPVLISPVLISPLLISPSPVQTAAPRPSQADPGLLRDSEEERAGSVLQTETENLDLNNQRSEVMKSKKEEERADEEVEKRCAGPDPVKEESSREQEQEEEGMSTLQAITLVFYLLAFLVILQRVWAYIGCFICI
ncbi:tripartite motif-containing protein 54-like [Notolabrus celidotus]|uniref:tripartite motif-containing protein 54-like n=1 Tax=Notolabrus celidotus TaxID=1203425 RepID=UPI00148FDD16|nr:tripartite motif-containing protein 54-like [Notolabrus celidotus]